MRRWQLFLSLSLAAVAIGASVALTLEGAAYFAAEWPAFVQLVG
jgi:hypothetical protein